MYKIDDMLENLFECIFQVRLFSLKKGPYLTDYYYLQDRRIFDYCIYISSSFTNRQFRAQLCNIENLNLLQNSKFINPYIYNIAQDKQQIDPSISPLVYDNKTSSAVGMTRGIDGLSLYLESLTFVAKRGVGTSVAIAITNTDITAKQEKVRVIL